MKTTKLKVKIPKYESAKFGTRKEGETITVPTDDVPRYMVSGAFEVVEAKKQKRKVT